MDLGQNEETDSEDDDALKLDETYRDGDDPFITLDHLCFEWVMQECELAGSYPV